MGSNSLPKFVAGRPLIEQLTAERLNQLVEAIASNRLSSGVGYTLGRNGEGGVTLNIRIPSSSPIQLRSLQAYNTSNADDGPQLSMTDGLIFSTYAGGFDGVPTIDGVPINHSPTPKLGLGATDNSGYFQIDLDDDRAVTGISLHTTADAIPVSDASFAGSIYLKFATIEMADGKVKKITSIIAGSFSLSLCRDWFSAPPTYSVNVATL